MIIFPSAIAGLPPLRRNHLWTDVCGIDYAGSAKIGPKSHISLMDHLVVAEDASLPIPVRFQG